MKKYLLSISLIFLSPTINAMNKSVEKSENSSSSRLDNLQVELLKNLSEGNYKQVSQLLEDNEALEPDRIFLCRLGGDLAYFLYKAAHEAGHQRLIQIIADNKLLVDAKMGAIDNKDMVMDGEIRKHPLFYDQLEKHFKEHQEEYSKIMIFGRGHPPYS